MADKSNEQIYAPFSVRFVAFILDLIGGAIVVAIVVAIVGTIALFTEPILELMGDFFCSSSSRPMSCRTDIANTVFTLILAILTFLYHIYSVYGDYKSDYFKYNYQATPGKYWLNLKVVNYEGKRISLPAAFGRFVIFALTLFFVPPIFLMIHFTERKQGLHDFICKTYVMQELTPDLSNKD